MDVVRGSCYHQNDGEDDRQTDSVTGNAHSRHISRCVYLEAAPLRQITHCWTFSAEFLKICIKSRGTINYMNGFNFFVVTCSWVVLTCTLGLIAPLYFGFTEVQLQSHSFIPILLLDPTTQYTCSSKYSVYHAWEMKIWLRNILAILLHVLFFIMLRRTTTFWTQR